MKKITLLVALALNGCATAPVMATVDPAVVHVTAAQKKPVSKTPLPIPRPPEVVTTPTPAPKPTEVRMHRSEAVVYIFAILGAAVFSYYVGKHGIGWVVAKIQTWRRHSRIDLDVLEADVQALKNQLNMCIVVPPLTFPNKPIDPTPKAPKVEKPKDHEPAPAPVIPAAAPVA
jgi:hypothetical protein